MTRDAADVDHALAGFYAGERVAVLAALIRNARGDFDAAEDALAEAAVRAVKHWRAGGVPERPGAWMLTVARRIMLDRARANATSAFGDFEDESHAAPAEADHADVIEVPDDRLALLFTCCHPALSHLAQLSLALRTIGGLTTREIARALLEPEATTAQRLVRTRRKIRDARIPFRVPEPSELSARMDVARETLYLVFNEGYGATAGDTFLRDGLSNEAIRLARLLAALEPRDAESLGLLSLMLLHGARAASRIDASGAIIPLEEQDRARWNAKQIREGERILDRAIALRASGPYQIQAAIAALHATAPSAAETDWRQIALLYGTLRFMLPTPVVELNAAVALAMVHGPDWGLMQLEALESERGMREYHLLPAARADLLRRAGRFEDAANAYRQAHALSRSEAERKYMERRLREME
jgi:RNA polymerase sigma-70 factor, ECF subfamily